MKDRRFTYVGKLIRTNEIKSFSEIINIIPKTTVARELGINPERFNRLLDNIDLFVIKDLVKLAELLEVDTITILTLLASELPKRKARK